MVWYVFCDEVLFFFGEIGDVFGGFVSVVLGLGGEFVDEVVFCCDEFFGSDLVGLVESGSVCDGSVVVVEGVDGWFDVVYFGFVFDVEGGGEWVLLWGS